MKEKEKVKKVKDLKKEKSITDGQKKNRFAYLNPKNLVTEVNRYGYSFSLSGFWKFFVLAFAGVLLVSLLYKLQLIYILFIITFSLVISPFIILLTYKGMYEQKRFMDVSNYLEQLLYSFRKHPKILTALEDAMVIFPEGQMHDLILKSMDNIQNKPIAEGKDIYHNAFAEMESFYGCRRMKQVHDFLIKVEDNGGDFDKAIDILLEDRRLWVERVYELGRERKSLKGKVAISLVLSFIICGMTMLMLPKDFATLDNVLCQLATTALIVSNIFIFYCTMKKLSPNWLDDLNEDINEIKRHYETVVNFNKKKEFSKSLIKAMIGGVILCAGIIIHQMPVVFMGGAVAVFSLLQPSLKLKSAKKRIMREVDKAFPVWVMELSLLLQTDNPQVSLRNSVEKAPYILKADLVKLIEKIEKNPTDITPYLNFMPEFDLPDVQSALRMLYSMSESGAQENSKQIIFLVDRNNRLLDKSERMRNEDSIAGSSLFILIPMVTGSMKMMVDLGVFLISLLSLTQNI